MYKNPNFQLSGCGGKIPAHEKITGNIKIGLQSYLVTFSTGK